MSAGAVPHCLNCGSTDLLTGVRLRDDSGNAHRIAFDTNPQGVISRGTIHADIAGIVCGSCGYLAFFAINPTEFVAKARHFSAQQRPT